MRNLRSIKNSVKQNIGNFSRREFREAYISATAKYHKAECWYLAVVIGEVIIQNRFHEYCKVNYKKRVVNA